MAKGLYHHIRKIWKKPQKEMLKSRLIEWRHGNAIEVVEKPLRLDRARALGYKAKEGFVMARVRISRGGRKRPRAGVKGRKTTKQTIRKTLKMNYRWVAEVRAARKFKNLEVLNSYWIGQDGKYYFYEIIMIDPYHPSIKNDKDLKKKVSDSNRKRPERGLTSAARKSRGLYSKSPSLKVRPSLRAHSRQGK